MKKVAPEVVLDQLEAAIAEKAGTGENPALLPPAELVAHIVATHHD